MNEGFSEDLQKITQQMRQEAIDLKHDYIGTEHLLLAILKHGENKVVTILQEANIDIDGIILMINEVIYTPIIGPDIKLSMPSLTARTKKVFEIAGQQSRAQKSEKIEPEHMLLGLLMEEEGVAAQVLTSFDFHYKEAFRLIYGIPSKEAERITFLLSEDANNLYLETMATSKRFGHNFTTTLHLLLSIIESNSPAYSLLKENCNDINQLQSELEDLFLHAGTKYIQINTKVKKISFYKTSSKRQKASQILKRCFFLAHLHAQRRDLMEIDTVCLLLGALQFSIDDTAIHILQGCGVDYYKILSASKKM